MNIVFYIRGLFHENNLNRHGNRDNARYCALFKEIYNLDIRDYRREINKIQQLNLNNIGRRVIVNSHLHVTECRQELAAYIHIPKHIIEELMLLDDNTIVIPLDDDDWISPDIVNYPFDTNALNIWAASRLNYIEPYLTPLGVCAPLAFDADLTLTQNQRISESLLSNCYGIPAKYIKSVITNTNPADFGLIFRRLMQLHSYVRGVVREHKILEKENIQDMQLAIYVRHLGNSTELGRWTKFNENIEEIRNFVVGRNAEHPYEYIPSDQNLWFSDYHNKLVDLNRKVINSMPV